MKKIVALVLSLVMALSLCTVAFAAESVKDGDTVYDAKSDATATAYEYVNEDYEAGGENYLPFFAKLDADGNWTGDFYYVGGKTDKTLYVAGGAEANLTLGDEINDLDDLLYNYKSEGKVEKQAWSCTKDELKAGYKYLNDDDDTVYCTVEKKATGEEENFALVLADGKIYKTLSYEPIKGQHLLYTKDGKDVEVKGKVGVYVAHCAACDKDIEYQKTNVTAGNYLYQDLTKDYADWLSNYLKDAAKPVGTDWISGRIYIAGVGGNVTGGTTKTDGIASPKTFDAGIAMYVGMSLLSVAGGAVVIGKKKEF